ncbi:MAG: SEC-C metal-binding domain-containing protein [Acidobacteriota bacterium]
MRNPFPRAARAAAGRPLDELGLEELRDALKKAVVAKYEAKEKRIGEDVMRAIERSIMLQVVDNAWKEHLLMLDHLKEGIHLRAQGQRDPLNEYKRESFELFERMKTQLEDKITSDIFRVEPITEEELAQRRARLEALRRQFELSAPPKQQAGPARPAAAPVMRSGIKIGRNDPCPCGSGKKYKKCCGTPQAMQA